MSSVDASCSISSVDLNSSGRPFCRLKGVFAFLSYRFVDDNEFVSPFLFYDYDNSLKDVFGSYSVIYLDTYLDSYLEIYFDYFGVSNIFYLDFYLGIYFDIYS